MQDPAPQPTPTQQPQPTSPPPDPQIQQPAYKIINPAPVQPIENSSPTMSPENPQTAAPKGNKEGIKGWLVVLIIVLALSVVLNMFSLATYPSIIADYSGIPQAKASVMAVLWYEVFMHLAVIGLQITAIVLIFQKKRLAKAFVIAAFFTPVALGLVDTLLIYLIKDAFEFNFAKQLGAVMRGLIPAALWTSYVRRSQRVQQTLTR